MEEEIGKRASQVSCEIVELNSVIDHLEKVVDEYGIRLASVLTGSTPENLPGVEDKELVPLAHTIRTARSRVEAVCHRMEDTTNRVEL